MTAAVELPRREKPSPSKAFSRKDLTGPALRTFFRIADAWGLKESEQMKLLGLDSSLAARRELAVELGCPPEKMGDSAQMNMWLHKTVLQKLAENGGNIPKDLLD